MANEYLKIIIEHTEIDFMEIEGFPVKIVFSLDVIEDVMLLSGYYTKNGVLVPATDKVRGVFGMFEEFGMVNDDELSFKEFQIEGNGINILWGRCRLRNVNLMDGDYFGIGKEYYIDFLGNNVVWFEDMKKIRLRDLGFGAHEFSEVNVTAKNNVVYADGDWGYTIVKMKEWEMDDRVMWKEHVPFLFVKSILRECFRSVGLEVVSEFFDYEPIERLVMPVFLQYGYGRDFYIENSDLKASVTGTVAGVLPNDDLQLVFDDDSSGDNFDNGGNYDTVFGEYNVPFAGSFRVDIKFKAEYSVLGEKIFDPRIVLFKDGVEWNAAEIGTAYVRNAESFSKTYLFTEDEVGSDMTFYLRLGDYDVNPAVELELSEIKIEIFTVEMSTELGAVVDFDWLLREDWFADRFIKGLKGVFNLMIDTRMEEGKVYIEPMDRYVIKWRDSAGDSQLIEGEGYFRTGVKIDKTKDVDLLNEMRLVSLDQNFTEFLINYKSDDETVKGLEENEKVKICGGVFFLNENRHKKGEKKLENEAFAKTLAMIDGRVMSDNSGLVPQFPVIWPYDFFKPDGAWLIDEEGGSASDYEWDLKEMRLLYFAGQRGGIDGVLKDEDGNDYDNPFSFMFNYNDGAGDGDFSLSFGNEKKLNGEEVKGLIHNFYLSMLRRMDRGKRFEGRMFWSDVEILNLSFRNRILMNGNDFLLRQIDGWSPVDEGSVVTIMDLYLVGDEEDGGNVDSSKIKGYFSD